ncbi:15-hydroxyprostaglandin dehydrogenase [Hyphodiscus hymeniophilus]|uniref:15-hydroxyprostaglandin dehydrogenase n=1 Tax=Hyphodiscus hymeniophilus TaxID=353542 RepID=A0A9P6VRD2_9HELO|nr:15-hydroxyprostaglandin dehydrogenase [Hyphodiscus hymeniophilus]
MASRIGVVTGANKGIGLAIVRNLALQYPKSPLHSGSFLIYLTARSTERGSEAVKVLNSDPALKKAKVLAQDGGDTTIKFQTLDISDVASIHAFRDFLKKEHPEGIDVLVNNAGIAMDGFNDKVVKETIHTNYYGSLAATQDLLPLIRPGGRLVNVASSAGHLNKYSAALQESFLSASKTSVSACSAVMEKFIEAVKAGKEKEEGFPSAAYAVSKAGEIAFTKAIAMEAEKEGKKVLINACCPGYVNTDMSKGNGTKTVDEGAETPVLLALGEIEGKTAGFWLSEKTIEW